MELFTVYLGRFIVPSSLTPPIVLPHYLPAERKEALLSLLVNGLGNPLLLRLSWPEIRIEPEGNRLLVNNMPLNTQDAIIVVRVGSEEEFRKAFKTLRGVPALLVIYEATRGGFVQSQKWLYDLNNMLAKAIHEAAERFGGQQLAEDLDFTFPLESFSDPLDILDFTNRYLEARGQGKGKEEAKKEAFGQVVASKMAALREEDLTLLLELVTKHTDQVIAINDVEGAERDSLQRLQSAGFLILSNRKLMLTAPALRLRDADLLEKAVLALEKKRGKALGESRKLYEDYLSRVRKPALEPMALVEGTALAAESHLEVPLAEVEAKLRDLEEMGLESQAFALMRRAFTSLQEKRVEEALAEARLAYEADRRLKEAYLAFLAYAGNYCLANWRLAEAIEYFRRYEAEGGTSWRVFWGLGNAYHKLGKWEMAVNFYERALSEVQRSGERQGEGAILTNLGNVYADQGRWNEAIASYEKALVISRELGDRQGEGQTLGNLGIVYQLQGRWEEAIACYEKALETFRKLGDRQGEAQTLGNLGNVYTQQGRWEEAIACYEESLRIKRELGDRQGEGKTLTNLGSVYADQGRWEEAIACYEKALETFRELGDPHGEAQTLGNLGIVYADQGRWNEAIACYKKALEIFRELGDRQGEGITLTNLGNVYRLQGHWEEAIACYEKALEISRELGDRQGEGKTLMDLGIVYAQQGRWNKATANYEKALETFRELGDRQGEGITLGNLGSVYAQQGRWEEAIANYEKALETFRELGDRQGEAQTLGNLGIVYQLQGRWNEAIACYEESLRIKRELGDRHGEGKTLGNMANIYAQQGKLEKALENATQALRIFEELKAYPDLVTCHRQMASLSLQAGDASASFSHLAQALSLALQLHPKLVLDTIDGIVAIAKGLASEGRFSDVAVLGSGLWEMVMKMGEERSRSEELKLMGMLAQWVCSVIALMGASRLEKTPEEREKAKEMALTMAKKVDEATSKRWMLEEWANFPREDI